MDRRRIATPAQVDVPPTVGYRSAVRALDPDNAVRRWLLGLWLFVFLMVAIGGITRLTGSGLSIVEWRPVTGALPPLDDAQWHATFDAYRQSPQFRAVNPWMDLGAFKRIYFWEYVHRLVARLIGVAFLLPWLYFVATRKLRGAAVGRTAALFVLGGLQGAIGWYMVKSGLLGAPSVSHFRLAMHLLLALVVGMWSLWQALELVPARATFTLPRARLAAVGFVALLGLQIAYGAFMAGTHAGYMYTTFPDMNGHYLPSGLLATGSLVNALAVDPVGIHYVHRVLGFLVLGCAFWLSWSLRSCVGLRWLARALPVATAVQFSLGALAVVMKMPLLVAALHQLGAYVLCSIAVALCHALWRRSESVDVVKGRDRDGGLAGARQDLRGA